MKPGGRAASWIEGLRIGSRILAAVVGGYGFTYSFTAALALWLPLVPAEAVYTASLLSFGVYTAAAVWVFSIRSATRAWLCMAVPSLLFVALIHAAGKPFVWAFR